MTLIRILPKTIYFFSIKDFVWVLDNFFCQWKIKTMIHSENFSMHKIVYINFWSNMLCILSNIDNFLYNILKLFYVFLNMPLLVNMYDLKSNGAFI